MVSALEPCHMKASPRESYRLPLTPAKIPDLLAFWDFQDQGSRVSVAGGEYVLQEMAGPVSREPVPGSPFGPCAARIEEGQWLCLPRSNCPALDRHGSSGHLTVLAWIRRGQTREVHCEFIAGQWNETNLGRQYGLFLNIDTWGGADQVCAHVSRTGGPTPGYRYCMDGAIGATAVSRDRWSVVGMSYDGVQSMAWLDGCLDSHEGLNPYSFAGGLHDGGPEGSDFTVGAVHRSGEMGNFYTGYLGGLAIFSRALSPAEIWALSHPY